jgi:hypothetical protein
MTSSLGAGLVAVVAGAGAVVDGAVAVGDEGVAAFADWPAQPPSSVDARSASMTSARVGMGSFIPGDLGPVNPAE